mmetsp:Transcript_130387/g.225786  ORF Transcript_130387/g.225786 Transcript_130387/m.225786 type:complete len:313 (-) Transcript_130387:7-945(-)
MSCSCSCWSASERATSGGVSRTLRAGRLAALDASVWSGSDSSMSGDAPGISRLRLLAVLDISGPSASEGATSRGTLGASPAGSRAALDRSDWSASLAGRLTVPGSSASSASGAAASREDTSGTSQPGLSAAAADSGEVTSIGCSVFDVIGGACNLPSAVPARAPESPRKISSAGMKPARSSSSGAMPDPEESGPSLATSTAGRAASSAASSVMPPACQGHLESWMSAFEGQPRAVVPIDGWMVAGVVPAASAAGQESAATKTAKQQKGSADQEAIPLTRGGIRSLRCRGSLTGRGTVGHSREKRCSPALSPS